MGIRVPFGLLRLTYTKQGALQQLPTLCQKLFEHQKEELPNQSRGRGTYCLLDLHILHKNLPRSTLAKGLPLPKTIFGPACLKASAAVEQPLFVGFDIANIAGLEESESRMALSTSSLKRPPTADKPRST
nr:hypothetical protein Iba_chr12bCG1420 [Ipomoea batatas]